MGDVLLNCIKNDLITALESEILKANSDSRKKDMTTMLIKEYENAVVDAGFNLQRIFKTKDGRFKTKAPIQICRKNYIDVLSALYRHYYGTDIHTFASVYQAWLTNVCKPLVDAGHRSISTYYKYQSDYARFIKGTDLEKMEIAKIKASTLHLFYANITANAQYSVKTLADLKTIVNATFDYAINIDLIQYNIARQVSTKDLILKEVDNSQAIYTDAEREKLLSVLEKHTDDVIARMFIVLFCIPLRLGEIRALQWSDVDFNTKQIYIHREVIRAKKTTDIYRQLTCVNHTKGKSAKCNRYISMSDKVLKILQAERRISPFGYVFSFNSGNSPISDAPIYRRLKDYCTEAKINYLPPHKMRFWGITKMYESGISPAYIQYTAGHANASTTDHYKRVARLNPVDCATMTSMFG